MSYILILFILIQSTIHIISPNTQNLTTYISAQIVTTDTSQTDETAQHSNSASVTTYSVDTVDIGDDRSATDLSSTNIQTTTSYDANVSSTNDTHTVTVYNDVNNNDDLNESVQSVDGGIKNGKDANKNNNNDSNNNNNNNNKFTTTATTDPSMNILFNDNTNTLAVNKYNNLIITLVNLPIEKKTGYKISFLNDDILFLNPTSPALPSLCYYTNPYIDRIGRIMVLNSAAYNTLLLTFDRDVDVENLTQDLKNFQNSNQNNSENSPNLENDPISFTIVCKAILITTPSTSPISIEQTVPDEIEYTVQGFSTQGYDHGDVIVGYDWEPIMLQFIDENYSSKFPIITTTKSTTHKISTYKPQIDLLFGHHNAQTALNSITLRLISNELGIYHLRFWDQNDQIYTHIGPFSTQNNHNLMCSDHLSHPDRLPSVIPPEKYEVYSFPPTSKDDMAIAKPSAGIIFSDFTDVNNEQLMFARGKYGHLSPGGGNRDGGGGGDDPDGTGDGDNRSSSSSKNDNTANITPTLIDLSHLPPTISTSIFISHRTSRPVTSNSFHGKDIRHQEEHDITNNPMDELMNGYDRLEPVTSYCTIQFRNKISSHIEICEIYNNNCYLIPTLNLSNDLHSVLGTLVGYSDVKGISLIQSRNSTNYPAVGLSTLIFIPDIIVPFDGIGPEFILPDDPPDDDVDIGDGDDGVTEGALRIDDGDNQNGEFLTTKLKLKRKNKKQQQKIFTTQNQHQNDNFKDLNFLSKIGGRSKKMSQQQDLTAFSQRQWGLLNFDQFYPHIIFAEQLPPQWFYSHDRRRTAFPVNADAIPDTTKITTLSSRRLMSRFCLGYYTHRFPVCMSPNISLRRLTKYPASAETFWDNNFQNVKELIQSIIREDGNSGRGFGLDTGDICQIVADMIIDHDADGDDNNNDNNTNSDVDIDTASGFTVQRTNGTYMNQNNPKRQSNHANGTDFDDLSELERFIPAPATHNIEFKTHTLTSESVSSSNSQSYSRIGRGDDVYSHIYTAGSHNINNQNHLNMSKSNPSQSNTTESKQTSPLNSSQSNKTSSNHKKSFKNNKNTNFFPSSFASSFNSTTDTPQHNILVDSGNVRYTKITQQNDIDFLRITLSLPPKTSPKDSIYLYQNSYFLITFHNIDLLTHINGVHNNPLSSITLPHSGWNFLITTIPSSTASSAASSSAATTTSSTIPASSSSSKPFISSSTFSQPSDSISTTIQIFPRGHYSINGVHIIGLIFEPLFLTKQSFQMSVEFVSSPNQLDILSPINAAVIPHTFYTKMALDTQYRHLTRTQLVSFDTTNIAWIYKETYIVYETHRHNHPTELGTFSSTDAFADVNIINVISHLQGANTPSISATFTLQSVYPIRNYALLFRIVESDIDNVPVSCHGNANGITYSVNLVNCNRLGFLPSEHRNTCDVAAILQDAENDENDINTSRLNCKFSASFYERYTFDQYTLSQNITVYLFDILTQSVHPFASFKPFSDITFSPKSRFSVIDFDQLATIKFDSFPRRDSYPLVQSYENGYATAQGAWFEPHSYSPSRKARCASGQCPFSILESSHHVNDLNSDTGDHNNDHNINSNNNDVNATTNNINFFKTNTNPNTDSPRTAQMATTQDEQDTALTKLHEVDEYDDILLKSPTLFIQFLLQKAHYTSTPVLKIPGRYLTIALSNFDTALKTLSRSLGPRVYTPLSVELLQVTNATKTDNPTPSTTVPGEDQTGGNNTSNIDPNSINLTNNDALNTILSVQNDFQTTPNITEPSTEPLQFSTTSTIGTQPINPNSISTRTNDIARAYPDLVHEYQWLYDTTNKLHQFISQMAGASIPGRDMMNDPIFDIDTRILSTPPVFLPAQVVVGIGDDDYDDVADDASTRDRPNNGGISDPSLRNRPNSGTNGKKPSRKNSSSRRDHSLPHHNNASNGPNFRNTDRNSIDSPKVSRFGILDVVGDDSYNVDTIVQKSTTHWSTKINQNNQIQQENINITQQSFVVGDIDDDNQIQQQQARQQQQQQQQAPQQQQQPHHHQQQQHQFTTQSSFHQITSPFSPAFTTTPIISYTKPYPESITDPEKPPPMNTQLPYTIFNDAQSQFDMVKIRETMRSMRSRDINGVANTWFTAYWKLDLEFNTIRQLETRKWILNHKHKDSLYSVDPIDPTLPQTQATISLNTTITVTNDMYEAVNYIRSLEDWFTDDEIIGDFSPIYDPSTWCSALHTFSVRHHTFNHDYSAISLNSIGSMGVLKVSFLFNAHPFAQGWQIVPTTPVNPSPEIIIARVLREKGYSIYQSQVKLHSFVSLGFTDGFFHFSTQRGRYQTMKSFISNHMTLAPTKYMNWYKYYPAITTELFCGGPTSIDCPIGAPCLSSDICSAGQHCYIPPDSTITTAVHDILVGSCQLSAYSRQTPFILYYPQVHELFTWKCISSTMNIVDCYAPGDGCSADLICGKCTTSFTAVICVSIDHNETVLDTNCPELTKPSHILETFVDCCKENKNNGENYDDGHEKSFQQNPLDYNSYTYNLYNINNHTTTVMYLNATIGIGPQCNTLPYLGELSIYQRAIPLSQSNDPSNSNNPSTTNNANNNTNNNDNDFFGPDPTNIPSNLIWNNVIIPPAGTSYSIATIGSMDYIRLKWVWIGSDDVYGIIRIEFMDNIYPIIITPHPILLSAQQTTLKLNLKSGHIPAARVVILPLGLDMENIRLLASTQHFTILPNCFDAVGEDRCDQPIKTSINGVTIITDPNTITGQCNRVTGRCECSHGFFGQFCEQSICTSNLCFTRGTASCQINNDDNSFLPKCTCNSGWQGWNCGEFALCAPVVRKGSSNIHDNNKVDVIGLDNEGIDGFEVNGLGDIDGKKGEIGKNLVKHSKLHNLSTNLKGTISQESKSSQDADSAIKSTVVDQLSTDQVDKKTAVSFKKTTSSPMTTTQSTTTSSSRPCQNGRYRDDQNGLCTSRCHCDWSWGGDNCQYCQIPCNGLRSLTSSTVNAITPIDLSTNPTPYGYVSTPTTTPTRIDPILVKYDQQLQRDVLITHPDRGVPNKHCSQCHCKTGFGGQYCQCRVTYASIVWYNSRNIFEFSPYYRFNPQSRLIPSGVGFFDVYRHLSNETTTIRNPTNTNGNSNNVNDIPGTITYPTNTTYGTGATHLEYQRWENDFLLQLSIAMNFSSPQHSFIHSIKPLKQANVNITMVKEYILATDLINGDNGINITSPTDTNPSNSDINPNPNNNTDIDGEDTVNNGNNDNNNNQNQNSRKFNLDNVVVPDTATIVTIGLYSHCHDVGTAPNISNIPTGPMNGFVKDQDEETENNHKNSEKGDIFSITPNNIKNDQNSLSSHNINLPSPPIRSEPMNLRQNTTVTLDHVYKGWAITSLISNQIIAGFDNVAIYTTTYLSFDPESFKIMKSVSYGGFDDDDDAKQDGIDNNIETIIFNLLRQFDPNFNTIPSFLSRSDFVSHPFEFASTLEQSNYTNTHTDVNNKNNKNNVNNIDPFQLDYQYQSVPSFFIGVVARIKEFISNNNIAPEEFFLVQKGHFNSLLHTSTGNNTNNNNNINDNNVSNMNYTVNTKPNHHHQSLKFSSLQQTSSEPVVTVFPTFDTISKMRRFVNSNALSLITRPIAFLPLFDPVCAQNGESGPRIDLITDRSGTLIPKQHSDNNYIIQNTKNFAVANHSSNNNNNKKKKNIHNHVVLNTDNDDNTTTNTDPPPINTNDSSSHLTYLRCPAGDDYLLLWSPSEYKSNSFINFNNQYFYFFLVFLFSFIYFN